MTPLFQKWKRLTSQLDLSDEPVEIRAKRKCCLSEEKGKMTCHCTVKMNSSGRKASGYYRKIVPIDE